MTNPFRSNQWQTAALAALACLLLSTPARAQAAGPNQDKLDSVVREAVRDGKAVRAIVRFHDEAARTRGARTIAQRGGSVRRLNDIGALNDGGRRCDGAGARERRGRRRGFCRRRSSIERSAGARRQRQFQRSGQPSPAAAEADRSWHLRGHHRLRRWSARRTCPRRASASSSTSCNGRHAALRRLRPRHARGGHSRRQRRRVRWPRGSCIGMAPEVDLVVLKVLDGTGAGRTSDVIAALEWVAANHDAYNIRVVNMSLGHPVYEPAATDPLVQAADALVRRGIVVVARPATSASNRRITKWRTAASPRRPTARRSSPSVPWTTREPTARGDDRVTAYSSRGPTRYRLARQAGPRRVGPPDRVARLARQLSSS